MVGDDENFYCVNVESTIRDAMLVIEKTGLGAAIVIDNLAVVVGVLTDGDLRRYLSGAGELADTVNECVNKEFLWMPVGCSRERLLKHLDNKISVIPILRDDGRLDSVVSRSNFPEPKEKGVYARARSPVRISFGGGGSDVTYYFNEQKGAVLNATISLYCHATLKKRLDNKINIYSSDLEFEETADNLYDFLGQQTKVQLIQSLINIIQPKFGFDLYIQSDFPPGSGLGGSSVVLAAVLGCFNEFRTDKWNKHELAELAFQAERIQLGVSGGWQDQYATIFGGFNFMEFDSEENIVTSIRLPNEVILELEESLFLMFSGTQRSSHLLHQEQQKNFSKKNNKELITRNVGLSYEIRNSLLRGRLKKLGELLNASWILKKQFADGISNENLDGFYDLALASGANGGKLLGAGGGGYFLFSVPAVSQKQFLRTMKNQNYEITPFTFDQHGLQSWTVRDN